MNDNYITLMHLTNIWKYIPNLEYFSLAYNSLVHLFPLANSIRNLTKLKYLDASHQYRTSYMTGPDFHTIDCGELFKNSSSPEPNQQSHKQLPKFETNISDANSDSLHIYYPRSLEYYNMSFALFHTTLYKLYLYQAENLKVFNIAGNQIKVLGSKLVFVDTPKHGLTMDASQNEISAISSGFFDKNSTANVIERLLLRANRLGKILAEMGCECIRNLINLKHLDLSDNRIKVLPDGTFKGMKLLETINVADNSIRNFHLSIANHKLLKHIDMSNNLVQQFETGIMDAIDLSVKEHILTINLIGNPLVCSCHTLKFLRWVWRHRDGKKILFEHLDNYTCTYGGETVHWKKLNKIITGIQGQCDKNLYIKVGSALAAFVVIVLALSIFIYRHKWDIKFWLIGRVIDRKAKRDEAEHQRVKYKYDAFVSYHQNDIEWVKGVLLPQIEGCKEDPMRLCLHHRDFEVGVPIEENIVQSIKHSRKTLLVVSGRFLTSHWCHFEIQMARMKSFDIGRNVIMPILIEPATEIMKHPDLSNTLLNILKKRTYLQWPNDPSDIPAILVFRDSLRRALRCPASKRIRCECGRSVCPSPMMNARL